MMMVRLGRSILLAVSVVCLGGCVTLQPAISEPTGPLPSSEDTDMLERRVTAQADREALLEQDTQWFVLGEAAWLSGRASDGKLRFQWHGQGAHHALNVELDYQRFKGWVLASPEMPPALHDTEGKLLTDVTWDAAWAFTNLPSPSIAMLQAVVQGKRPDPAEDTVWYHPILGTPQRIQHGAWRIDYLLWFSNMTPPMPAKIVVHHGPTRLLITLENWARNQGEVVPTFPAQPVPEKKFAPTAVNSLTSSSP